MSKQMQTVSKHMDILGLRHFIRWDTHHGLAISDTILYAKIQA
jgi:hypothetical protein